MTGLAETWSVFPHRHGVHRRNPRSKWAVKSLTDAQFSEVELELDKEIGGRSRRGSADFAFLKHSPENSNVPVTRLCWLELAIGRDDCAMNWLMTASRDAKRYLAWVDVAPMYDALRLHLGHSGVRA